MYKNIFKPFKKENNELLYVNAHSNHPPMILKNIPLGIENTLSILSSTEQIFEDNIKYFQEALKCSGDEHNLNSKEKNNNKKKDEGSEKSYGLTHLILVM